MSWSSPSLLPHLSSASLCHLASFSPMAESFTMAPSSWSYIICTACTSEEVSSVFPDSFRPVSASAPIIMAKEMK